MDHDRPADALGRPTHHGKDQLLEVGAQVQYPDEGGEFGVKVGFMRKPHLQDSQRRRLRVEERLAHAPQNIGTPHLHPRETLGRGSDEAFRGESEGVPGLVS
jgi:hypothetical protein